MRLKSYIPALCMLTLQFNSLSKPVDPNSFNELSVLLFWAGFPSRPGGTAIPNADCKDTAKIHLKKILQRIFIIVKFVTILASNVIKTHL